MKDEIIDLFKKCVDLEINLYFRKTSTNEGPIVMCSSGIIIDTRHTQEHIYEELSKFLNSLWMEEEYNKLKEEKNENNKRRNC